MDTAQAILYVLGVLKQQFGFEGSLICRAETLSFVLQQVNLSPIPLLIRKENVQRISIQLRALNMEIGMRSKVVKEVIRISYMHYAASQFNEFFSYLQLTKTCCMWRTLSFHAS